MESIYRLLSSLFDFTIVGAVLIAIIKSLQYRRNAAARNELQKLQALVSALRIGLKSKVKKRANSFRAYFPKDIPANGAIDGDLNLMAENKFETSTDFQKYFDLIKKTYQTLNEFPKSFENPIEGFIIGDKQNELIILKIVKEMKEISHRFNSKAENFNKLNPKNKVGFLDALAFGAMMDFENTPQDEQSDAA